MMAMEAPHQLVVFTPGEQRDGLPLSSVNRVARIVEITPMPNAPEIVLGLLKVQGRLILTNDLDKFLASDTAITWDD